MAGASAAPTNALPADKINLAMDYAWNGLTLNILERFYSPLRQSADPQQIFAIPNLPSYFITDVSLSYDFQAAGTPVTGFLNVSNLFNRQPDILQAYGYTGSPGMNYPVAPYEDVIGRYFTLGVKFKL
jgi:outer membrane receptor protein involved in Fe transport